VPAVTSPFGFTVSDQDEAQSGLLHKDSFSSPGPTRHLSL
jgi:hypothetical protein